MKSVFLLLCKFQSAKLVFPTLAASRARPSSSKAKPRSAVQFMSSAAALATAAAPALQLPAQRLQSRRQAPVTFSAAADKYAASLAMLHRDIFSDIKGLLQPLTESVSSLSSRLQSIEAQLGHGPMPAPPASTSAAASASAPTPGPLLPATDSEAPWYNLAIAASTSSSFQPSSFRRPSISFYLLRLIIQGKDVNLVSISIAASKYLNYRVVDCGDLSVTLKSCDPQLLKSLTLGEFVITFSAYRDVLCTAYPHRRQELDQVPGAVRQVWGYHILRLP
ncbi:UNVERIFIED_CONTAM: hypothetical protein FKN15_046185 [Acipenser sinensis]